MNKFVFAIVCVLFVSLALSNPAVRDLRYSRVYQALKSDEGVLNDAINEFDSDVVFVSADTTKAKPVASTTKAAAPAQAKASTTQKAPQGARTVPSGARRQPVSTTGGRRIRDQFAPRWDSGAYGTFRPQASYAPRQYGRPAYAPTERVVAAPERVAVAPREIIAPTPVVEVIEAPIPVEVEVIVPPPTIEEVEIFYDHPCGESEYIHDEWVEARDQAGVKGFEGLQAGDFILGSLEPFNLEPELLSCIAFEAAFSEDLPLCDAIDYSRSVGAQYGASEDQANEWADNNVRRLQPWYLGYETECPAPDARRR